ncbi:uncharacterized protein BP5553_05938 [Venustampulla echinocandica]|uniref:ERCC4 domain-containing protein n=1 Tax=Venustampulla echinocandica TaxID=2656787 RepID=A0A370TM40_9HELO|nr:uncharacterized protein BP5553_05938 [Venustampulla echinocandica]RDL36586.1 hypothetical protein BP5553_05938 [Venustampulla echinocandica]
MPIEIIDLLSSPDILRSNPTLPRAKSSKARNSAPRVLTSVPAPERILEYQAPNPTRKDDDWFILSSDGNNPDLPGPSPTNAGLIRTVTGPGSQLESASKPGQLMPKATGKDDFFFVSDDFDSTIDLDRSYALNEPPPKKRRLSSSPIATLPNTGLSRAREFKRSASNVEPSKTKPTSTKHIPRLRKSNTASIVLDSDPIIFTSSPDPFADVSSRRKPKSGRDWDYDVDEEDIFGLKAPPTGKGRDFRSTKSSDVGILEPSHGNKMREIPIENSDDDLPDIFSLPLPAAKYSRSSDLALAMYNEEKSTKKAGVKKVERAKERHAASETEKERKRLDKEAEKRGKLLAKETQKKQSLLAKEEKLRNKEVAAEVAKVNTLRTDKKVSTPEMILELPTSLDPELARQVRSFSAPLQVDTGEWENSKPIIKWKRKVQAKYNDGLGYWEPTPLRIEPEKHIICVISGQEFVDLATGGETNDLDSHVLQLRAKFPSCQIIYLMQGLALWMRKNKTVQNRKFVQGVRNQTSQEDTSSRGRAKKGKEPEHVNEDIIEDALLKLQVLHNTLVHHTAAMVETAQWIITFTQHISTIPYRAQKQSLDTAFCMETGQVKTGDDPKDTFTKMLQEINLLSSPIAYSIASEYSSVQRLVNALENGGPLVLEDLRKSANKDGAFTDRRIGPAMSKRVYKILMGRDPSSWDV